jgi:FkbM family methyltransferase
VKDFGLVVIGAHFGVWLESEITKYQNQSILLVEPVPYNYNKLKDNFKNTKNIEICTNAIFSENKLDKFYYVNENSISKLGKHWASGIGSFNKDHILNHKTKRFNIKPEDIDEIEIKFITFDDLIENYSIQSIDKLQIDVEGAEFEILNSIDYKKTKINSLQFESKHFDGTFKEGEKLEKIKKRLILEGYNLNQIDEENILAKK